MGHREVTMLEVREVLRQWLAGVPNKRIAGGLGLDARLEPQAQLENWDETAKITYDRALWSELVSLRFLEGPHHVAIVGPVGVGKTFLAHALGHIAVDAGTASSPSAPIAC